jgi:uncharacterized repeat protein (TIGR01451 family)
VFTGSAAAGTSTTRRGTRWQLRRIGAVVATMLVASVTAVVAPVLTGPASATTVTYGSPGTHSFVVPAGVTSISATVEGASGGTGGGAGTGGAGGGGAVVPDTTLAVTPGETLTIYVGGAGTNGGAGGIGGSGSAGPGGSGLASGGSGGAGGLYGVNERGGGGGGGGGASAIVRGTTPLVVGGGGGGGGGHGRQSGTDNLAAGAGGGANSNGSAATTTHGGSGGTCCSTSSRGGGTGTSGGGTPITGDARGGGGGGGSGYDGGTNGGGNGGSTGSISVFPLIGGAGGGGAGGRSWRNGARYTPTAFNTGNGEVVLTYQTSTTTTLSSSVNPSVQGQPVTFSATVTSQGAGTPTGTVTFFADGAQIGGPVTLVDGVATFTTSSLAAGSHAVTAQYAGSTDFVGSTSNTVTQVVEAAAPALHLVASADPVAVSAAGQTIAYAFTITNTGNVTVGALGVAGTPTPPAGPVPSITCDPTAVDPGGVSTCTGSYTVSEADIAGPAGQVVHTFTATGTDAVLGGSVGSNPFSVAVDVRVPQPGLTAIVVNTGNTVGLTP